MLQDETCSLYHIYSCLRYRAENWVLTILSFNKISSPRWAEICFSPGRSDAVPCYFLSESNLNSLQTTEAGHSLFSPLLFAKTTHSFSSLIWAWQPAALGRKVLEGKQHVCLQPDKPGISTCHGALGNPFADLAGSSGLLRWVLPRALTHPRRINSLGWDSVWVKKPHCFPPSSTLDTSHPLKLLKMCLPWVSNSCLLWRNYCHGCIGEGTLSL